MVPLFSGFDGPLAFGVFLLACAGMLTMYSSGFDSGTRFTDHGRNMLIAGFIMFVVAQVPPQRLAAFAVPLYVLGVSLLIAVAIFGITKKGARRWLNVGVIIQPSEILKIAMPLMILGTIVLNLGVWGVVTPLQPAAHMIIYVGATPAMLAALLLLIWSWGKLIQDGTAAITKPKFGQKINALLRDPLKFGPTWQMLFMNFTTSGIGIFMAVKLDEIFRVWPAREERIELTGHWHVLSAIIATIILLYYADMVGLKGKVRQWFGWLVILGSDLAFAAVTVFEVKRLFVSEADQQPVVNWTMALADIVLVVVLLMLAGLMVWRLADLFKRNGQWQTELRDDPHLGVAQGDAPDSLAAAQELSK